MSSIDIVIPAYNEQDILPQSVTRLRQFLEQHVFHSWTIIIADNGSTDNTAEVGRSLSQKYRDVRFVHLKVKGRGWALYHTWRDSQADIVSYMDVDLSTRLEAFPKLIQAIEEGYDIAIGSRLLPDSQVERSPRRELFSRTYNRLVRLLFKVKFSDTQCGFKAARARSVREILPRVKDRRWFFDTELLIQAHRKGHRVKEIPISWKEEPNSHVDIVRTIFDFLKELLRLRFRRL